MRLIDAFKLTDYANNTKDKTIDANDIMRFPAVDAVPVVRCQNCRRWKQHTAVDSAGNLVYLDSGNCGVRETNKDDYCSLAVRREDNDTNTD